MKLMWFKNDLRLADNPALFHACSDGDPVVALYMFTPKQWQQHDKSAIQVDFIRRHLHVLQQELAEINIPLCVLTVDEFSAVPNALISFCQQHDIDSVFYNQEYEWNERQRDQACNDVLDQAGIAIGIFEDQCLVAPHQVKTGGGDWYKVFTPFRKNWQNQLDEHPPQIYPIPDPCPINPIKHGDAIPTSIDGFESIDETRQALWPAGSEQAYQHLTDFLDQHVQDYGDSRNRPDLDQTSRLSPYLAIGAIGNRQCYVAAQRYLSESHQAVSTWISELCWRDFYRHVLVGFPHVSRGQAFNIDVDKKINWSYDQADFERWKDGKTGVPIVDAAMRALKAEGWMHNRLRMVTAMFLTKDLLIDWRLGEQYFSQQLIDGDLASNNGGWQWSASTGTDAAPYFRIMNPFTQGETHDPDGVYIRRWLPELASLQGSQVHDLKRRQTCTAYPAPMVDHKAARQRAIEQFKAS